MSLLDVFYSEYMKIIKINGCHDCPVFVYRYPKYNSAKGAECLEIWIKGNNSDITKYVDIREAHPYCPLDAIEE